MSLFRKSGKPRKMATSTNSRGEPNLGRLKFWKTGRRERRLNAIKMFGKFLNENWRFLYRQIEANKDAMFFVFS
jgi:hypothetical protein